MKKSIYAISLMMLTSLLASSCTEKEQIPGGGDNNGGFINYNVKIDYGFEDDVEEMKNTFFLRLDSGETDSAVSYSLTSYCVFVNGRATDDKLFCIEDSKIKEIDITQEEKKLSFGATNSVAFYLKDYPVTSTVQVEWQVSCKVNSMNKTFSYSSAQSDKDYKRAVPVFLRPDYDYSQLRYNLESDAAPQKGNDGYFYLTIRRSDSIWAKVDHDYNISSISVKKQNSSDEPTLLDYAILKNGVYVDNDNVFNFSKLGNGILSIKVKSSQNLYDAQVFLFAYTDKWSDELHYLTLTYSGSDDYSISAHVVSYGVEKTMLFIEPSEVLSYSTQDYIVHVTPKATYDKEFRGLKGTDNLGKSIEINENGTDLAVNFSALKNNYYDKNNGQTYSNCYVITLNDDTLNDDFSVTCTLLNANGSPVSTSVPATVNWMEPVRKGLRPIVTIEMDQNGLWFSYDGIILTHLFFESQVAFKSQITSPSGWTGYDWFFPYLLNNEISFSLAAVPFAETTEVAHFNMSDYSDYIAQIESHGAKIVSTSSDARLSDKGIKKPFLINEATNFDFINNLFSGIQSQKWSWQCSYKNKTYYAYYLLQDNIFLNVTDMRFAGTVISGTYVKIPVKLIVKGSHTWTKLWYNTYDKNNNQNQLESKTLNLVKGDVYYQGKRFNLIDDHLEYEIDFTF